MSLPRHTVVLSPVRHIPGEWSPWAVGILLVCIVVLLVAARSRRQECRGHIGPGLLRDDAEGGYLPADLRGAAIEPPVADAEERWLLGLAAPFVETEGLLHHRWSLVPAPCNRLWQRRLTVIADRWGVGTMRAWTARTDEAQRALRQGRAQVRDLAVLAMLLRLGVAARYTTGPRARVRLRAAAAPLRTRGLDWRSYGNAFLDEANTAAPALLRANVQALYNEGGPWHDPRW